MDIPNFLPAGMSDPMSLSTSLLGAAWGGGLGRRGLLDETDGYHLKEVGKGFAFAGVAALGVILVVGIFCFTLYMTGVVTRCAVFAYWQRKEDAYKAKIRRAALQDLEMNGLFDVPGLAASRKAQESLREPPPTYHSA
ncbi:hypothetical protein HJFPF1_09734 [Paramyrothecium foliicola]|nr:hypothetical protein HJFPF1_09734 [Paramyrothecium foliicola]